MSKRAIILPFKESFSEHNSGAASIFVKESLENENIEDFIIYGSKSKISKKFKNSFYYNSNQKKYFRNYHYIKFFTEKFFKKNFSTIEIHNRPEYIKKIRETFPTSKIIFYFHNDPNTLRGSKTSEEKKYIAGNCKIVFLSKWMQNKFGKQFLSDDNSTILYPGVKKKKFLKKEKIIFFCGKLNHSKGYDIFIEATKKLKSDKKYSNWKIISAGTESRRVLPKEDHISELGQISNKEVFNLYKKSSISVAPSNWDEPLGRLPIEASAHGSIPITSKKGGLIETNLNGFILKKNNADELYKLLIKLVNKKNLININTNIYKKFKFTKDNFNKLIFKIRNDKVNKIKKVLLISNLNLKNKKRLFYSFFNKLNIGLKDYHFNYKFISDRDYIRENRKITDLSGIKSFNSHIVKTVNTFMPDLIILGHTDRIYADTFRKVREINKNIKIIKIFIDSIADEFFNFEKIFYDYKFLDNIFISSNPIKLKKQDYLNKINFIPYHVDKKIDYLKAFNNKKKNIDVFFALSHGQNRGVLKAGRVDEREKFLKKVQSKLSNKINILFVGLDKKQPLWGINFYNAILNSKILINLSRGTYKKYYSSDRISTLIGNGCFVLNEYKNEYYKFFNKTNELINYKSVDDLVNKINYYLRKPKLRNKISKKCYYKYHSLINSKLILSYVLNIINKKCIKNKYLWT